MFRSLFTRRTAEKSVSRPTAKPRLVKLEPRETPALMTVQSLPLASLNVVPGQQNVPLAQFRVIDNLGGIPETLKSVRVGPAVGSANLVSNFTSMSLRADLDGNGANGYEATLATAVPTTSGATFTPVYGITFNGSQPLKLQVTGNVKTTATGPKVGIKVNTVNANLFGVLPIPQSFVAYSLTPTLHHVQTTVVPDLYLTQLSTGTTDTVVSNAKNVNLLRFRANSTGGSSLLTDLVFSAPAGTNINNGTNFSLWMDTNADTVVDTKLQSGVVPSGNNVVFDRLTGGGTVIAGPNVLYEVHADIGNTVSGTFGLKFATNMSAFVQAEDLPTGQPLNGIQVNGVGSGKIHVTTTNSITYNVVDKGDLIVKLSTTPVRPLQLLLGATSALVFRLTLTSRNEGIDVTNLQLSFIGLPQSLDRVQLFREGATTPFGELTVAGNGSNIVPTMWQGQSVTTLSGNFQNQQLVVPKGTDVTVLVKVVLRSDINGGVDGEAIRPLLIASPTINYATGLGTIKARGLVSAKNLGSNDGDGLLNEGEILYGTTIGGPNVDLVSPTTHTTVGAHISSITNASPVVNGSPVPTGVSELTRLKFRADPNTNTLHGMDKVAINGLVLDVEFTNVLVATNSFRLFNAADQTQWVTGVLYDLGGNLVTSPTFTGKGYVVYSNLVNSSVNTTIDQNTDLTLSMGVEVLNPKISGTTTSTMQGKLTQFTNPGAANFGISGSHLWLINYDGGYSHNLYWLDAFDLTVNGVIYNS
jgi:hypothetical protein